MLLREHIEKESTPSREKTVPGKVCEVYPCRESVGDRGVRERGTCCANPRKKISVLTIGRFAPSTLKSRRNGAGLLQFWSETRAQSHESVQLLSDSSSLTRSPRAHAPSRGSIVTAPLPVSAVACYLALCYFDVGERTADQQPAN